MITTVTYFRILPETSGKLAKYQLQIQKQWGQPQERATLRDKKFSPGNGSLQHTKIVDCHRIIVFKMT